MPGRVDKGINRVMFSRWSTLWFAAATAGLLLVLGVSLSDAKFWILLTAIVGPCAVWELVMCVIYARRGKSYFEFKRGLGDMTLAELQRRKEARRS